jgi:hypothetical protein
MLSINNRDDRNIMMNYHRTKDMINLINYFPSISPVKNLTIVDSYDDYLRNFDYCKHFINQRNDTLISKPSMKSIEVGLTTPDIVKSTFKKVKELDNDGVVILFDLTNEPSLRYERYAGIAVGVSIPNGVYIDAVGKGFDGREISKGIASHERYFIPWFDLSFCNIDNFKSYQTYLINDDDYKKTREARIEFLKSIGFDENIVNNSIPKEYKPIPDFVWLDIIKNIIVRLNDMEEELTSVNLSEFAIHGHTEGRYYSPWQIFDDSRFILKRSKTRQ